MKIVDGAAHIEEIRALFQEYASWIGRDLSFQRYADELEHLPGKYARPEGRLYLALSDTDEPLDCGALRDLGQGRCEMKRLYVRPGCRGGGIGAALIALLLEDARQEGYQEMVLDTLSFMKSARSLYHRMGFEAIPPYYENPMEDVFYLRKRL